MNRVIRGGAWNNNAHNCRSAYRNNDHSDNRNDNLGFRLASSPRYCLLSAVYGLRSRAQVLTSAFILFRAMPGQIVSGRRGM